MSEKPNILIVEARFYDDIADELRRGAVAELDQAGAAHEAVAVPGAFEIPAAIRMAIRSMDVVGGQRRYDGYIALGCVIRGATPHFDYVAGEAASGLSNVARQYDIAVGFGVLTVDTSSLVLTSRRPTLICTVLSFLFRAGS